MRMSHLLALLFVAVVGAPLESFADDKTHRELIQASTSKEKGAFHVVFTETIKSKDQRDWKDAYAATVEVFKGDKSLGKFRASTLPNFLPGKGKPEDWKYAVVQATCAFPADLKSRYYKWTRMKRVDGKRPCLRLAKEVPTVNISSLRVEEMSMSELLKRLEGESKAQRYLKYAEDILVHSGKDQDWRGSAGCLTLHPDDAQRFFDLIPEGERGTLELNRVIEDEAALASYCY